MAETQATPSYADAPARAWPHANKALLLLRLAVGLLFIGHGGQKLFGWFGGKGIDEFAGSLTKAGIEPSMFWAYFEATAETAGGALLALGLLTPLAAAALVGDMLVATLKVHAAKGFWSQEGGFEYNLVLIVLLVGIGLMGPGRYSLDQTLGLSLPRPLAFIGATLAALVVVAIVTL
ncbi:MAG TPA: DoxX family protein [Chloroflexota bacterium]|jgi:putative oxidoreductase